MQRIGLGVCWWDGPKRHKFEAGDKRSFYGAKCFFLIQRATATSEIRTGTSTRGPITAVKATPEWIPKTATETAIASSKLLLAAVNERVAACSYVAPTLLLI